MPSSTTQEPKTPQKNELAAAVDDIKSKNPYSIESILQSSVSAGGLKKRKISVTDPEEELEDIIPDKKASGIIIKHEETSEEELKVEDDENDD